MRGPPRLSRRSGDRPQPVNEADARTYTLPAPYGGWNARGNLSNMAPTDAVVMDNVFPGVQDVTLRKGSVAWTTGFAANIKSLHPYNNATTSKVFASTDAGIYDATSAGAVGAAVSACTNGLWESVNYATTGGSFLTMVNGVDNARLYDGTTWETVTGVSAHAITGIATTSLSHVNLHKKRLWFVEKDSMNLWYLAADSIAGAATRFPVGAIFRKGGKVLATATWTLDGGNGIDDYLVICTTHGELAVYQGTDPASSSTWALIGVYAVGAPLGRKPFCNYGGDLLYLSSTGLYPLSKLAQSAILDRSASIGFKIDGAFLEAAEAYASNTAWQVVFYPAGNMLLANIPTSDTPTAQQFVMNTITQAWCRFLGWNASAWAVIGSSIYFASGTSTYKAWTGTSDTVGALQGSVMQAYNRLGMNGQKHIELIRPLFTMTGSATVKYAIDTDFSVIGQYSQISYLNVNQALWDSSRFDIAEWDEGGELDDPVWRALPNQPGYYHSFRTQIVSSTAEWAWTATNYAHRPAGIL